MKDNDVNDMGKYVDKVGIQIRKERKSSYIAHKGTHITNEDVSSTLQALLSEFLRN